MTAGFHNPEICEVLPNACSSPTARDVFDFLPARQESGGQVHSKQEEIAVRLCVSRAVGQLRDRASWTGGSARDGCSFTRCWPATSRSLTWSPTSSRPTRASGRCTFPWMTSAPSQRGPTRWHRLRA